MPKFSPHSSFYRNLGAEMGVEGEIPHFHIRNGHLMMSIEREVDSEKCGGGEEKGRGDLRYRTLGVNGFDCSIVKGSYAGIFKSGNPARYL